MLISEQTPSRFVSVLIVDQSIESAGIIANTSLVLGLTAGRELPPETFGPKVTDGEGSPHEYLTSIGHHVRKAGQSKLRSLRQQFLSLPSITVVDYTEDAAPSDYSEYARNLASHTGEEIRYRAIYVYGPEESVVPVTKNLSRL